MNLCRSRFVVLTAVCLAVTLLTPTANAQDGVRPDTLDWHGYYPLDVGTIWEWRVTHLFGDVVHQRRIEADTLVAGLRWLIQVDYVEGIDYGETIAARDTLLVRYDDPYGRVLARSPLTGEEWDYTCDLSGDFGAEVLCGAGLGEPYEIVMGGSYAKDLGRSPLVVGTDTVAYAAAKQNPVTGGAVEPVYFHGVGRLPQPGDGYIGTIAFTYLRLEGIEYGSPALRVRTERPGDLAEARVAPYPNPVSETLTLVLGDRASPAFIRAYDLRGRLVLRSERCASPCRLDVRILPAGVYLLDVEFGQGTRATRRFVVAR